MSAAELFHWPVTKWTHACGNFIESTMGSPRFCATCSFTRHVHKRKEATVSDDLLAKFRAAVAAIKALPSAQYAGALTVALGVDAVAARALATVPGARTTTTLYRSDGREYALEAVWVNVDGIEFHAQYDSRPLTDAEREKLDREGRAHGSMVTA